MLFLSIQRSTMTPTHLHRKDKRAISLNICSSIFFFAVINAVSVTNRPPPKPHSSCSSSDVSRILTQFNVLHVFTIGLLVLLLQARSWRASVGFTFQCQAFGSFTSHKRKPESFPERRECLNYIKFQFCT